MSLKTLLATFFENLLLTVEKQCEVITFLLDISGSTDNSFNTITVLQKEISIAKSLAALNRDGTNYLVTFHTHAKSMGLIKVSSNGTVMFPLGIIPQGYTHTHRGFEEILSLLDVTKTTKVVLITDGQTNSSQMDLQRLGEEFKRRNVEIEIVAVSAANIYFNRLTSSEEKRIPGLDVVNMMNKSAKIYTPLNTDTPFELAKNVDLSTKIWSILGLKIPKNSIPLPTLITEIINILLETDLDFSSTEIQEELTILFTEIGMLLGLVYIKFPDHFLEDILKDLESKTGADLSEFVQYGFQLKQQNRPFIHTNITRRLVEYKAQQTSFQDATEDLRSNGTALGEESISFNNGIICFVPDSSSLLLSRGYSVDKHENIFFSFGSKEQAIRQGLRSYFGEKCGFRDSRNSPSVIFGVATQILLYLLCCSEINLDDSYIEKLRKLARIQCGQKKQERDRNYGNSFIEEWKAGNLPVTHYSSKNIHADLYLDNLINPLGLSQTLWWAVMMMIIDNNLFNAQMIFYEVALQSEGIEPTETSLLAYIREKFSSKVAGTVKFSTIDKKKSVITLDDFSEGSTIFENFAHISSRGSRCDTKTHYSAEERVQLGNKCVWCNQRLNDHDYKLVVSSNEAQLTNHDPPRFIQRETRLNATAPQYVPTTASAPTTVFRQNTSVLTRVLIVMEGTVGAGKTTFSQHLQEEVEKLGGQCINEGTDKYCLNGIPTRDAVKRVTTVLRGISRIRNNLLVVIIDTCGERNTGNVIFGYSFDGWEIHRIRPNFDESRIRQYLCWSLRNVLNRPLHSRDSNFWLNPESATVNTCKKVHTDKATALFGRQFVNVSSSTDLHDILNDIELEANEYQEYLNTSMPIESCVKNLIARITHS